MSATLDDAAGEAFDKVAKILDLGYPGGPVIEQLAKKGNPKAAGLSCLGGRGFEFSFSGIKTAVLYKVTRAQEHKSTRKDMAAGFQQAVVKVLVERSLQACRQKG